MEKLSVIIPAYNAEDYLTEAIMSVKGQNWSGATEIIIIDDGSVDGTVSIAKALGDIVLRKDRGGAASARNMGINAATGNFIFLLDADDILENNAFERLYDPFRSDQDVMAVFGKARDFISPELTLEQKKTLLSRKGSYGGVLPGCSFIRHELFEKIGMFDESLKTGETVAWQMELREGDFLVVNLDHVILNRRLHMNNTGRVAAQQEMLDYAKILRRRMKKV